MCSETRPRCEPNAERPSLHVKLCVRSHQSAISPVVEGLMEVLRASPCAAGKEFAIETALREALANAVLHGSRNDSARRVECSLSCSEAGALRIVVRDSGAGFDPAGVPDPLTEEGVRSTHGRGIFLINSLMDRVWFERGGTEIHMVLDASRRSSTRVVPA